MSDLMKLSVSKSATFNSCKAKYKFSYILRLPRKEFEYHIFGRFVHRILELFHLEYINGNIDTNSSVMSKAFNDALIEFKGKISSTAKNEAIEIIKNYLQQLKVKPGEIEKIISVEKNFNIQINDRLILNGMIDRVQLDSDGIYHIIDYKTSKSQTYLKDDTLQLLTYAYVIYSENPSLSKVRVSYIMLRHNCEYLTKEFSLEEIISIKDIYEKYADDIFNEKEFKPTPTKLCEYCDYIRLCEPGLKTIQNKFNYGKTDW